MVRRINPQSKFIRSQLLAQPVIVFRMTAPAANEAPKWITDVVAVVSAVGLLPTIGSFLHTLNKDRGVDAQRTRVLEQAKTRMDFWKTRLDIQEKTLSEEKFEAAKEEANEATENIRREASESLVILSLSGSPTPVVGLPKWRKLLLLYRPLEGSLAFGYIGRALYWLSLAPLLLYVYLPFYLTYLYCNEPKANRAADLHALFHSKQGRGSWIVLGLCLMLSFLEAAVLFNSARREGPRLRIKAIDRI